MELKWYFTSAAVSWLPWSSDRWILKLQNTLFIYQQLMLLTAPFELVSCAIIPTSALDKKQPHFVDR